MSKSVILTSRFWINKKNTKCDKCNCDQAFFFLGVEIANVNEKIVLKYQLLCSTCINVKHTNHFGIANDLELTVLKDWLKSIATFMIKKHKTCKDVKVAVEIVLKRHAKTRNKFLCKMGKVAFSNCAYCKKKADAVKFRCGGCHIIRYCSQECSQANWEAHKKRCKNLANHPLLFLKV